MGFKKGLLKIIGPVVAVVALSACQTTPSVYSYPTQGQTANQYINDKIHCREWARMQHGTDQGQQAVNRGTQGAVFGALLGGLFGRDWKSAGLGAGAGAAAGGLYGATSGQANFNNAYRACMETKGYNVR